MNILSLSNAILEKLWEMTRYLFILHGYPAPQFKISSSTLYAYHASQPQNIAIPAYNFLIHQF